MKFSASGFTLSTARAAMLGLALVLGAGSGMASALQIDDAHSFFENDSATLRPDAQKRIVAEINRSNCTEVEITGSYDPSLAVDKQLALIDRRSRVIEAIAQQLDVDTSRSVFGVNSFDANTDGVRMSVTGLTCGTVVGTFGAGGAIAGAGAGLLLLMLAGGASSSTPNTN